MVHPGAEKVNAWGKCSPMNLKCSTCEEQSGAHETHEKKVLFYL